MKLRKVGISLLAATLLGLPQAAMSVNSTMAEANVMQQQDGTVSGVVKDSNGEPVFGAIVFVVGTTNSTMADMDGNYKLDRVSSGATVRAQMMGFTTVDKVWNGGVLNFVLDEESTQLDEMVVTAMGIVRKEKSLTYSTQQIKADDIMKVQDMNLVNSLEGKISGITITPSAGGAGGASKITLRGNKSIQGDNAPLIVVDGVPMTNGVRGQIGSSDNIAYSGATEGSDPLSMINPDDIESMNVLKGANAAALYGSRAANGVLMITTKKGKEGKMEVTFNSNTTFETPLLTPELQNIYGGVRSVAGRDVLINDSWGNRLAGGEGYLLNFTPRPGDFLNGATFDAHMRRHAADDIEDFFDTGITLNNSVSVSGGTEKVRTYVSYSNSHSMGMIESNRYNRNTFAFRQNYKLWDKLVIDVNANYVQSKTKNRVGGGGTGNPIYHLYTTPRDVDMGYYKNNYEVAGSWLTKETTYYEYSTVHGGYDAVTGIAELEGPLQNWAFQETKSNNPYWLTNKNFDENQEDRFFGSFQANYEIIKGLNLQARISLDYTKYTSESGRYASTWGPDDMYRYGSYYLTNSKTNEIYTDYLLSYNTQLGKDWSLSATAGYVGHTIKSESVSTSHYNATIDVQKNGIVTEIPTQVNVFYPNAGYSGSTTKGNTSNWDQAALFTAQVGWKDKIFVDASYRQDWYRPFKQFKYLGTDESYGYFGVGANAIVSDLIELPKWWTYAKYRLSYSEVGNSIPNTYFNGTSIDLVTGAIAANGYNSFHPEPEKTKSFETGLEMQFLRDCLNVDVTYYNSAMHKSYLVIAGQNGKKQPVNSGVIRNQGIELSVGYDWKINNDWRWKTNVNFSYNYNEIEETYKDETGLSKEMSQGLVTSCAEVRYEKGGSYGDIYVKDFTRYGENIYQNAEGKLNNTGDGTLVHKKGDIFVQNGIFNYSSNAFLNETADGYNFVNHDRTYGKFVGNMNSDYQLSWSNTFTYKDFSLYFLINGRIGGKVISMTEAYLDQIGSSKRTGAARAYAEANGIYLEDGTTLAMDINEGRDRVAIEQYYKEVGANIIENYIYDATNFRLRELSLGYTFRNLFGDYKNLSLSFVCRNLFFIYKDAPVDPDVSISTGNSLGALDMFNMPSARSFGFNLKLNL
ncbi:MAG: SusC/RagA family TonB-linked outer membrane protein [Bacteroidaceae bacterium]|nr:SusC/RagA family TonB-linked outer membrane protein [Bacteroidaceae bacterium]